MRSSPSTRPTFPTTAPSHTRSRSSTPTTSSATCSTLRPERSSPSCPGKPRHLGLGDLRRDAERGDKVVNLVSRHAAHVLVASSRGRCPMRHAVRVSVRSCGPVPMRSVASASMRAWSAVATEAGITSTSPPARCASITARSNSSSSWSCAGLPGRGRPWPGGARFDIATVPGCLRQAEPVALTECGSANPDGEPVGERPGITVVPRPPVECIVPAVAVLGV